MTQRCAWLIGLGLALSATSLLSVLEPASAAEIRGTSAAAQERQAVPTVSLV